VADEEGELAVFQVHDPILDNPVQLLAQHPRQLAHFVNSGGGQGDPRDYRVLDARARWVGHYNSIFDLDFVSDRDNQLLTASGDITCKLWDLEKQEAISNLLGHKKSVRCVRSLRSQPSVVGSGGRDGKLLIYDTRANSGTALLENRKTAELMLQPVDKCLFAEGGFMLDEKRSTTATTKRQKGTFSSKIRWI
jgi:WD40 repeat protein